MPDEVEQPAEDENRFDLSEFERELESIFSDPEDLPQDQGDETPDGEDGADGAGEGSSEGEQPPTPAPSEEPPADEVQILDRTYSTDDARALVEFYDWVKSNPQQAIAIDSYLKGQATFTPVEAPGAPAQPAPAPVDEEIFEDLPEVVKQKLTQVDALQQRIDALDQERAAAYQADVQGAISRGSASFKERFSLTDDEVSELQQIAAGLNIASGIVQNNGGDLVAAVEESLEMAYWRTEKFRDVAVSKYAEQQAADTKRQAKASSLSGGSGSVPRTPKTASTSEDRRQGMVAAITQAMSTQQQE